ncbi:hypothetical protein OESDEN_16919 [Oesophagostomum dentatum]|uniref:Uncharacterized protein n=1 Tax=Oesophagostomum dentatum TaxID=61180 RepID=A0A0B1SEL9_OESDE|nr:hypothetical protein OESDEN_16919 [Oesophagostomum dentatum]
MQWYLVAPILFLVQRLVTDKEKIFFAGVSVLSIASYLYSRNMIAAYWLQARLWQFCTGVIAALCLVRDYGTDPISEEENLLKREKYGLTDSGDRGRVERSESKLAWPDYARSCLRHPVFLLPLLIPVMWFRFPTFDLRLYITAASALILYAGQKEETFIFITNRVTVFLGDISYILYLVQWPVHCIAVYYNDVFARGKPLTYNYH